jgi:hypothetical protein
MNLSRRTLCISAVALSLAALSGCATKIKASSTQNPAPAQAFSYYGRIDVKPVAFQHGHKGNVAALGKIGENLSVDLAQSLAAWNAVPENGRTLTVEPVVEEMSFKSTGKRIMLGGMAGGSGVRMRLNIKDQSGNVVASPEFYQRASAMAGAYTFGTTDNLMLTHVANLASGYLIANYAQAVGGPTGADEKAVAH